MSNYETNEIRHLIEICMSFKKVKTSQQLQRVLLDKLEMIDRVRESMAEYDKRGAE